MLKKLAIACATATAFTVAASTAAEAVMITLGGTDYDVTTIMGTFSDNQALLESQPWFVDPGSASTLGNEAAMQIGNAFGFPNFGGFAGPLFGEAVESGSVLGSFAFFFGGFEGPQEVIAALNEEAVWAVATEISAEPGPEPVPEPMSIFGSLVALGIGSQIKRRGFSVKS